MPQARLRLQKGTPRGRQLTFEEYSGMRKCTSSHFSALNIKLGGLDGITNRSALVRTHYEISLSR